MAESHNQFGDIIGIRADAVGQPGHRRFRLLVEAANGRTALLWLEKEQLFDLAIALKRVVAIEGDLGEAGVEAGRLARALDFDATELDFQVGRMSLQHDNEREEVSVTVYSAEPSDDVELPDLSFTVTFGLADVFASDAMILCASGRPLCPLCRMPVGQERHICPMRNGHGHLE